MSTTGDLPDARTNYNSIVFLLPHVTPRAVACQRRATMATTTTPTETTQTAGTAQAAEQSAADLETLFPGRYVSVTSFKRDGTGVATPVWAVSDGARLFALTDLHSAKVRRLRRNPHVLVASCRVNGKLRGDPVAAHAEVLPTTAELERVRRLLVARYKVSYRVVMLVYRLGRRLRGKQAVAHGAALAIRVR